MDLAGAKREVDLLQRTHGAKALADPTHLQQGSSGILAVLHDKFTPKGAR
ncbi:hypothetical protein ACVWZ6_004298 [Bradyrhizobium sp. GM6.1]